MINPDFTFNGMRGYQIQGLMRFFYRDVLMFYFSKVDLSNILQIMVQQSLFWCFQLMDLSDIFFMKKLNEYQTVFIARPTVDSLIWIPVFGLYLLIYNIYVNNIYMNSFQFKLISYHLLYGRFFFFISWLTFLKSVTIGTVTYVITILNYYTPFLLWIPERSLLDRISRSRSFVL